MNGKRNNFISFSLWGDKPIYTKGAIQNTLLAKRIYPGWKVIMYYDHTVPNGIIDRLRELGVILIDMSSSGIYALFWRFLAADLPDCNYAIFRDTDSRLSKREKLAVDEWLKNGDTIHIMRDHPFHEVPFGTQGLSILGGMWGIRGGAVPMTSLIESFIANNKDQYGVDQNFLKQIYLAFEDSKTVHDEFFEKKPFPLRRKGYRFIGERMTEEGKPLSDDWVHIKNHYRGQRNPWFKKIGKLFSK